MKVLVTIVILAMLMIAATDDGSCVEDGEPGLYNGAGECITAAEYDILFGYDNLSTVLTQNPFDGATTVAEVANIHPHSKSASQRLIGVGLIETPTTFIRILSNGLVMS